ncbi:MAG: response regulator [Desulfobacteraceae bacterium]|nr:response regulator [Desulfobacteraceae bacterium]
MNLCTNAIHAMEEKGGILKVSLANVAIRDDGSSERHYVRLNVRDTGVGISPEAMEKVFDPYFTTKAPDKGTGLGLAIVHRIVQSHNGVIRIGSKPDEGTDIEILFPMVEKYVHPDTGNLEAPATGKGHILFVDDEELLADVGKHLLEKLGYTVTTFKEPTESSCSFKSQPDVFDILITDMDMPDMNGVQLIREILKIRQIPVIITTGFSENITREEAAKSGVSELLMKPLTLHDLAASVQKVIKRIASFEICRRFFLLTITAYFIIEFNSSVFRNINNMTEHDKTALQRAESLSAQRQDILSLASDKKADAILDYPHPAALVHSFPEGDFHFLIHEIGIGDSLELLGLASERQWEYLTDIDIWKKDMLEINSLTRWLYLFISANPKQTMRWCLDKKTELIEPYLFHNIDLTIREHDQDPSDFGDGFFTFDDIFYVRFKDNISDVEVREQRDEFLHEFLKRLIDYNHEEFQYILMESFGVIPSESEEEAWRLRNIRLAEKGFVPFYEAVGIYQPVSVRELNTRVKRLSRIRNDSFLPVPMYAINELGEDNLFTRALTIINIEDILHQIQSEFASLCNHIISADGKTIRDKDSLKSVVRKACGYLSIGLEQLDDKHKKADMPKDRFAAALIQRYHLNDIFRVGYGQAMKLRWQAEKWRKSCWFENAGLPLAFWEEEWLGVLGGLLLQKPLYFDNYKTGVIYREFQSSDDIAESSAAFEKKIMAFDNLLSRMNIRLGKVSRNRLSCKNLILTLWARHHLNMPEEVSAIGLDEFAKFFNELWITIQTPQSASRAKQAFLSWISDKSNISSDELTQTLGQCFELMFGEIESEYGEVSQKNLDRRYIRLFLVK